MNQWRKGIAQWRIGKSLYLSIPFTWLLPEAKKIALGYSVGPVFAGGPAIDLLPDFMAGIAQIGQQSPVPPLPMHNPLATFTTRGCIRHCPFCAVPRIEGEFKELQEWPIRPVICDNNFLASSMAHFNAAIDTLKQLPFVDFNQGLDARIFTAYHADRLGELKGVKVRFAFDHLNQESHVADAIALARRKGLSNLGCYVLIGFKGTPEEDIYRLQKVRQWGIRPNPMRYQPLNILEKNSYLAPGWTEWEMLRTMQYFSRLRWLEHIPFNEYRYHAHERPQELHFGPEAAA